jgi:hypothetical protein
MPTLEPIVVNAPKEKKTYTYSENDIVDIVAQVIKQGKIEAGAGFEEVEVKLYLSDISVDLQTESITIANATKKQQIYDICQQVIEKNKIVYGTFTFPNLDATFEAIDKEKCNVVINGLLSYVINENAGAYVTIEKSYAGIELSNGFLPVKYGNDTVDVNIIYIGYDENYLQAVLQSLALDTNKYVLLKFRVEK